MDPVKLHSLLQSLTRPGLTAQKKDDVARERLHVARVRCLECQLLLQEASALSCSGEVDQAHAASLHHAIQVACASQMLMLPESLPESSHGDKGVPDIGGSIQHYLGVHPNTVMKQHNRHLLSQQVAPLLEKNLESQVACLAAALCTEATQPPSSRVPGAPCSIGLQGTGTAETLTSLVPDRQAKLAGRKAAIHVALARQLSLALQLLNLLSALSDELQVFARGHILDKQQALDQFRVQLATEHCRSLCHKLQVVELQIDSSVYTQDSIAALSKVREHLSSRKASVSSALKDVKQSLQAYADLGAPFEKVAKRYLAVHNELASVQQSLATFAELERELTGPQ